MDHKKLWKILKDGNTRLPDLPLEKSACRSRINRTGHGTKDWFQIRRGASQGCTLSPYLFNLYAEYIMRNTGLDEAQAGINLLKEISISYGEGNGNPLQYSCLENPIGGGAWWATVHGVANSQTHWVTSLSLFTFIHWRRKWQPTQVFLPGESQGHGSLVGCCLWGLTESDTTEATQQQQQQYLPML